MGKKYLLSSDNYSSGSAIARAIRNHAKNVNGVGTKALEWIGAVESLVLRQDLRFLTLIPWANVITTRGLLRRTQAWCPECFEEWRLADQAIYTPLLWSISAVKVCLRHKRPLVELCPVCGKQVLILSRRSFPGYCCHCIRWLGDADSIKLEQQSETDKEWQAMAVRNIGELIAKAPELTNAPNKSDFARVLRSCVDQATGGRKATFASLIDTSETNIQGWYYGRIRPSLADMLNICQCLDIPLFDFLMGTESAAKNVRIVRKLNVASDKVMRPRRITRPDLSEVERDLLQFANKNMQPISLTEAAKRIGLTRRYLYAVLPEVSRKITSRYMEFRRTEQEKRRKILEEEIRQAVFEICAQGMFPSQRRVAKFLNKTQYHSRRDVGAIVLKVRETVESSKESQKPQI